MPHQENLVIVTKFVSNSTPPWPFFARFVQNRHKLPFSDRCHANCERNRKIREAVLSGGWKSKLLPKAISLEGRCEPKRNHAPKRKAFRGMIHKLPHILRNRLDFTLKHASFEGECRIRRTRPATVLPNSARVRMLPNWRKYWRSSPAKGLRPTG